MVIMKSLNRFAADMEYKNMEQLAACRKEESLHNKIGSIEADIKQIEKGLARGKGRYELYKGEFEQEVAELRAILPVLKKELEEAREAARVAEAGEEEFGTL